MPVPHIPARDPLRLARGAGRSLDSRSRGRHHPAQVGPTDRDPVMEELFVETIIGIALIIISALEIVWITRTVTANTPR
jgi:hypothetical protein